MTRPPLSRMVLHEARALWLVWAGSAAACIAVATTGVAQLVMPGWLAYFVGSVTLAAMTVGNEYTHGTLSTVLSLPIDRRRLVAAKLLAVMPMLGVLALLALTMEPRGPFFERDVMVGAGSVVAAVALAPWLTMMCRNPLAGVVFAVGLAGMMHIVALGLLMAWFELGGTVSLSLQTIGDRLIVVLLIAVASLGVVCSWRSFMTLEAIEGRDSPLTWPRWLRSQMVLDRAQALAPPRRTRPLWLLVRKELRLQEISIAVATINVLIWAAAWWLVSQGEASDPVLAAVGVMYGALLAVLIGAVASASERQMGTHAWQQLLPFPAWQQWVVKTVVVVGLSLGLAFGLPVLLARGEMGFSPIHAGIVVMLTIGSMFVSSLCRSALQAMTLSAPALFIVATLLGWSLASGRVGPGQAFAGAIGVAVLAWWFGFVNHRTAR